MLAEIVRLCRAADERLDSHAEAFDRLRDLEGRLPDVLSSLAPRVERARARVGQEEQRLQALRARYAEASLASVADNVDQARQRLGFAANELTEARTTVAGGRRGEAVVSVRAAEEAVGQAETLLEAVARVERDLSAASGRVAAARAETMQDLAEARALIRSGDPAGIAPVAARAEAAVTAADEAMTPGPDGRSDPLTALRQLEEADTALEQALAAARDASARNRRAAVMLEQALLTARAEVEAVDDFIATRRGAVGGEARTRLMEARRHLADAVALSRTDPATALQQAQYADALAQ